MSGLASTKAQCCVPVLCTVCAVSSMKDVPLMQGAVELKPMEVPETWGGSDSVADASSITQQAWWQAVDGAINATQVAKLSAPWAVMWTGMQAAKNSIVTLRTLPVGPPCFATWPGSQPSKMEPTRRIAVDVVDRRRRERQCADPQVLVAHDRTHSTPNHEARSMGLVALARLLRTHLCRRGSVRVVTDAVCFSFISEIQAIARYEFERAQH
jgi:hypothetical protein